jgi:Fe-S cluster assembly ATP-binding protein
MLDIKNLHASIGDKPILKGLDLSIKAGEVHAIMGPNGSGKSTLAQVLAGRENFHVTQGEATWLGQDLFSLPIEERARSGLFLAFQYPIEIPGVSNAYFLKAAVNAVRKHQGLPELDAMDFIKRVKGEMKAVGMREEFLYRSVNEGFSGGEKKRNEVLQMALLEPKLAILDETDSGLDIDALKAVAEGVNRLRSPDRALLVITHYQRLLDYIVPDYVHVLAGGRIVRSGGRELALELEERGYGWIEPPVEAPRGKGRPGAAA